MPPLRQHQIYPFKDMVCIFDKCANNTFAHTPKVHVIWEIGVDKCFAKREVVGTVPAATSSDAAAA